MADGIVGRGAELAAVEGVLDRSAGMLAALVLEGEAGIGKSTIWEAAVESARTRGHTILVSRATRSEQQLTLGGLTDLLSGLDDSVLAALPGPQRYALEVALLRTAPSGAPPDQRALSVAAAGLLRRLAGERPLLLAVDDAQWLDLSSAAVLAYAVRRLADRSVALLLAIRTGAATPAWDELVAAVPRDRVERVDVGPMPLGSLHALLEAKLGRSFPRLVHVRVEAASGGNPLYALEIGRELVRTGVPATPGDAMPVPRSLAALMGGRIDALPERTRGALLLAAAAFEPTPSTLRAAGVTDAALAPAVRHDVLALEDEAVRFRHPLLAQAVLAHASPAALRRAHAALAGATSSADARARHLGQAAEAPDEAVASEIEGAAASARDRGASLAAAALYQEAARLTPAPTPALGQDIESSDAKRDDDQRLRRSLAAAECLFVDLSEIVQSDAILEAALVEARPGPRRAEALSIHAILRYYHGRVPEAVELGRVAADEAGADPVVRATILGRAAFLAMQLDLDGGIAMVDEAVGLLEEAEAAGTPVHPDLLANVLLLRAVGEMGAVRPVRRGDVERGLSLITESGRSWEREGADGSALGIARISDDIDRAIILTRELIRTKSGPTGDDPWNMVMLATLLLHRGDWPQARRLAEEAMGGYEREGSEVHPAWALYGLALVAAHDGRDRDAREWAVEGLRQAEARGDGVLEVFHHQVLGFLALSAEAWGDAATHHAAAEAAAARISTRHPGRFKLAGDEVETALALGDVERAAAVVARLNEAAAVTPTPWVLAVGARCAALLAAARGDSDGALLAFERALAEHERLVVPFERGRTLLAKGRLHRRRREKRLADEVLHEALACFERLGAPGWAGRPRPELRRVGLRPRAPERLTETEALVAGLAARGLSNGRIAEQAFLAPKTVGNVLGRVYEKLGIHSRAELGALMAPDSPLVLGEDAARD